MSIFLFSDGGGLKGRICSPFPLSFKGLFVLCLSFTFSPTQQRMFLWDFSLWKQYLCVFLQSHTALLRNSKKFCEGRIYLKPGQIIQLQNHSSGLKRNVCLHSQDQLRRNALNFTRSIDQLLVKKRSDTPEVPQEGSFQREIQFSFL